MQSVAFFLEEPAKLHLLTARLVCTNYLPWSNSPLKVHAHKIRLWSYLSSIYPTLGIASRLYRVCRLQVDCKGFGDYKWALKGFDLYRLKICRFNLKKTLIVQPDL